MQARGVWLPALLLLAGLGQAQAAGTRPETVAGVVILRGPGSGPLPKLEPPPERRALAGSRLWLVDEAAGTVTSCRNVPTANAGVRRIRCTRGQLPPD
jgi:hypothetical protein